MSVAPLVLCSSLCSWVFRAHQTASLPPSAQPTGPEVLEVPASVYNTTSDPPLRLWGAPDFQVETGAGKTRVAKVEKDSSWEKVREGREATGCVDEVEQLIHVSLQENIFF